MPAPADAYPLIMEPLERELIWGGRALAERFGKPAAAEPVGESWECWDENRVRNGPAAGRTLAGLRADLGHALTGTCDPALRFPLLTKFIDACAPLSVQVHPDDAYARRVEHQPCGKTECWYVLEALPGATIVLGWNRPTSREELFERVADASLGDLLRHVPVAPGDIFYLPAGTLHAIGAGIVLFEVQQASDLTYRIFDYDRRGPDGRPRELHVAKAADVLDFDQARSMGVRPLSYDLHGLRRTTLVAAAAFILEHVEADDTPRGLDLEGTPVTLTALHAPLTVEAHGVTAYLGPFETAVVPAAARTIMLCAPHGKGAALVAGPPAGREAIERRFSRAAVPVAASTAFLAQFA